MDVVTYASLLKKIKEFSSGQVTPEQIKEIVKNYLDENPINIDVATLEEVKTYLEI